MVFQKNDNLLAQLEFATDLKDLARYGLTQEELDGYVDFFVDCYLGTENECFFSRQRSSDSSPLSRK
jgi:hypothetical protein